MSNKEKAKKKKGPPADAIGKRLRRSNHGLTKGEENGEKGKPGPFCSAGHPVSVPFTFPIFSLAP
ncbi:hypothetical protein AKJ64_00205 [candidate division MSBL1 archaeon SCGC-AAA259E17]|uniref:Uncharacterized protein n=1 Tax=candidate division MSBL1 archaeon SCGC-AAA259E17 TaxID=1698263 RepID=A0A133UHE2_9EURY|nr:hypothetical protein AKJ64_00205 [candidate division MSBL1 archaeon SCGC-AAA259E17]